MVDARTYERTQHQIQVLELLARGTAEIEAGVGRDMDEVFAAADTLLADT